MYLTIIILPLLSSISSGFFGRKLGVNGSNFIISSSTTLLLVIILWGLHFYSLTVSMLIPVLIVSLVHIYSIGYMQHDPHKIFLVI